MTSRSKLALLPAVIFFFVGLMVWVQAAPGSYQARMSAAQTKEARKLFKQKCVRCHGADGAGETTLGQVLGSTDLSDPEWHNRVDDQRLINSVTHGRGQMPAFGKKLTQQQIRTLVAYMRALKRE